MPIDASLIGRSYPPGRPYEVGREKVRDFARAIGDDEPAYDDASAAQGLGHADTLAPPTFATVLSMRAAEQVLGDPDVDVDLATVVHGEERYTYDRPIRVGDVLVPTVSVADVRSAGGHVMLTVRTDVATPDGEHVLAATSMIVIRGDAA